MRRWTNRSISLVLAVIITCLLSALVVAAASGGDVTISQKSRLFNPSEVTIAKDQSLIVVNDDGDLLHHAYIESDAFSFDSGDQKPGSRTPITFPVRGDFKMLCGIHPKMKLTVHVR